MLVLSRRMVGDEDTIYIDVPQGFSGRIEVVHAGGTDVSHDELIKAAADEDEALRGHVGPLAMSPYDYMMHRYSEQADEIAELRRVVNVLSSVLILIGLAMMGVGVAVLLN